MEQLRAIFTTAAKMSVSLRDLDCLKNLPRRKLIETFLYMIRTYPFCSISHQLSLQILNTIKEALDNEDLQTLKEFVKVELSGDTSFVYPSGNEASGMNMGQIIKIAFELRNITQKALDDEESSGEEESGADEEGESRREEMRQWFRFCKEKVEKIEKVWNRKLDAYEQPSDSDSDAGFDPSQDHDPLSMNDDDHEAVLDQMFKKFSDNK